jgi:hypothetical protein
MDLLPLRLSAELGTRLHGRERAMSCVTPLRTVAAVAGTLAAATLILVFAIGQIPAKRIEAAIPAAPPAKTELIKKEDRAPIRQIDAPVERSVATERIAPDVALITAPPIAQPPIAQAPAPAAVRPRFAGDDICTRHGMHKEISQSGRSWRCRR